MAKLVFRQEAIEDLNGIWDYTVEKWSLEQAEKYCALIRTACMGIASGNHTGRKYEEIHAGLLGYAIGKHIIFYQKTADEVEVIRILHEMMDLKSRLKS